MSNVSCASPVNMIKQINHKSKCYLNNLIERERIWQLASNESRRLRSSRKVKKKDTIIINLEVKFDWLKQILLMDAQMTNQKSVNLLRTNFLQRIASVLTCLFVFYSSSDIAPTATMCNNIWIYPLAPWLSVCAFNIYSLYVPHWQAYSV